MRDEITATVKYATEKRFLVLYVGLFVGLSLLNWNVFAPLFGLFVGISRPVAMFLRGVFGFLTAVVGFAITAIAFVAIVRTVVDDALGAAGLDMTETASESVADDADEADEETTAVDASEDGQTAEN